MLAFLVSPDIYERVVKLDASIGALGIVRNPNPGARTAIEDRTTAT
jgi:hypothetical protein